MRYQLVFQFRGDSLGDLDAAVALEDELIAEVLRHPHRLVCRGCFSCVRFESDDTVGTNMETESRMTWTKLEAELKRRGLLLRLGWVFARDLFGIGQLNECFKRFQILLGVNGWERKECP